MTEKLYKDLYQPQVMEALFKLTQEMVISLPAVDLDFYRALTVLYLMASLDRMEQSLALLPMKAPFQLLKKYRD